MRIYLEGDKNPVDFSLKFYRELRSIVNFKRFLNIFSDQILFIITSQDEIKLKKLTDEKIFQKRKAFLIHNKKVLVKWESSTLLVYNLKELAKYCKIYNKDWHMEKELIFHMQDVFRKTGYSPRGYEFVNLSDCSPDSPELQLLKASKGIL